MLILGFESSAKTASVALLGEGGLIAQYFQNSGLTHSRTLLPMAEAMLKNLGLSMAEIDLIAVAHGPGSFTGVRIGVSIAKGLAWGLDKRVCGVSTLEAMAFSGLTAPEGSLICCAMDARRAQVYNALFEIKDEKPVRLFPDRAIGLDELCGEIKNCKKSVFFVGDGAQLCYNSLREAIMPDSESFSSPLNGQPEKMANFAPDKNEVFATLAPEPVRYQSAWGVCMAAKDRPSVSAGELLPIYLRLSQAERERQARIQK